MIIVAVFVLLVSHPGPVFARVEDQRGLENVVGESKV